MIKLRKTLMLSFGLEITLMDQQKLSLIHMMSNSNVSLEIKNSSRNIMAKKYPSTNFSSCPQKGSWAGHTLRSLHKKI